MFTVLTDHQPLTYIFDPKKRANSVGAARLHRWSNLLASYQYKIEYRKGGSIGNADRLSRLPLSRRTTDETVNYFSPIPDMPLTAKEVAKETDKDDELRMIREMTWQGWPKAVDKALEPYFIRRYELFLEMNCLLWNNRVVIPKSLRKNVLDLLHEEHPGINKREMLARGMVWRPNIHKESRNAKFVTAFELRFLPHHCSNGCGVLTGSAYTWTSQKEGKSFLVMIDSHSK